jgi:hypothetical protein
MILSFKVDSKLLFAGAPEAFRFPSDLPFLTSDILETPLVAMA